MTTTMTTLPRTARLRVDLGFATALLTVPVLAEQVRKMVAGGRAADEPAVKPTFRQEGEFWTVAYAGETFHLRDAKGLRYLAFLLGGPGAKVHALELARAAAGTSGEMVWPSGMEDVVLDAEAKEAYRQRLQELGEDLQEARDWHDPERAARIEHEIDALTTELVRVAGLGGRDRRFASPSERARVSVTKAIRSAIKAIDRHSPALGAHLARSVHTGRFCSYAPPAESPPQWML